MDPKLFKTRLGDSLAYWGTMGMQHTFSYGTSEDMALEEHGSAWVWWARGGLILAPAHAIQLDVSLENLRAYY